MFPEARIAITLSVAGGSVRAIAIHSTRLVQASKLFAGRTPPEIIRLLPAVFSLCGTAQRIAAEKAFGTPQVHSADLLTEIIAEHGLGMARDWPMLVGEAPDMEAARALRGSDRHAARAAFARLLGAEPETILGGLDPFRHWAETGASPAARLMREALALGHFGAAPFRPMPQGGPIDLAQRLEEDCDGDYVACPHGGFETGPLARQAEHPLVSDLLKMCGASIATRLAARLTELSWALQEPAPLLQDWTSPPASGLGTVEAARGLLAHRVELEKDGRVKRYQILAPTEWNFHPTAGPLVRGLVGAPADDLERRARLLVHALDPCVACSVTVDA